MFFLKNADSSFGNNPRGIFVSYHGYKKTGSSAPKEQGKDAGLADEKKTISMNYPEPTWLSAVISDVVLWSKMSIIMDPETNCSIQIFAPKKLSEQEAFNIFLASLETQGLRALQIDENIIKIVKKKEGQIFT